MGMEIFASIESSVNKLSAGGIFMYSEKVFLCTFNILFYLFSSFYLSS